MTFKKIINAVLLRMREATASDWSGEINDSETTDDYHKLIGELVNETKQTVEDSWNWGVLRTIETVTTASGTTEYTMDDLTTRSRIMQIFDSTNNAVLKQISDEAFYNYTFLGSTTDTQPQYYRLKGNTISFYPTPDAAYTIKVHAAQPQDDLTNYDDEVTVPSNLIVLGTYALALAERGEDGGSVSDVAAQRFTNALTDAITQDEIRTVNETTWNAS